MKETKEWHGLMFLLWSFALLFIVAGLAGFFKPEPVGPPKVQPSSAFETKRARPLKVAEKLAMEKTQRFTLQFKDIPGGHPEPQFAKELETQADFDQPLENLLKAGKYEECSELITEKNFPAAREFEAQGKRKATFVIFELCSALGEKGIMTSGIIKEMKRHGYHPATLREMLIFGKELPEAQRKFTLFGLGSFWLISHPDRPELCPIGLGVIDDGGKPEGQHGRKIDIYKDKDDNWVNGYFLGVKMVPGEETPFEE
jgi:hypothetical protein